MAAVVLAHEIGGGFGHLLPWRKTLADLQGQGLSVAAAVPGGSDAASALCVERLDFPGLPGALDGDGRQALSWPAMLRRLGYARATSVDPLFRRWHLLLQQARPRLLIADHAPLAMLAAKTLDIPILEAGPGFCVPPATHPMRSLPGRACAEADEAERELQLVWARLPAHVGSSFALDKLADLFSGHRRWVCSVSFLDPYGPRHEVEYRGPLPVDRAPREASAAAQEWLREPAGILGYLKLHTPGLKDVLRALESSGRRALIVVPGIGGDHVRGRVRVTDELQDLPALLPHAGLFVTNGGVHGVGLALEAGVRILAIPMHLEQRLTGERLAAAGAGAWWHPEAGRRSIGEMLTQESEALNCWHHLCGDRQER